MKRRVSVVLPTLEEADNIVPLLEGLYSAVTDLHEVIIVDDGSTDGTARRALDFAGRHPHRRVSVLSRAGPPSLARSIWEGVLRSEGDIVVWMDCDLSMPPEAVPRLLARLDEGFDLAVGSRFVPGGSPKTNVRGTRDAAAGVLLSRLLNAGLRGLLGSYVTDHSSGFIAARRSVILGLGLRGHYGEYFVDLMGRARRKGWRIAETPYVNVPRLRGSSKTGTGLVELLRRGFPYAAAGLRLRWEQSRRSDD